MARNLGPDEPVAPLDEATLLARARHGDHAALERLIESCVADAFDVAYRILADADLAEDAVQEGMFRAVRGFGGFRGAASFRTWTLTIVANAARSLGRANGRRAEVSLDEAGELASLDPDPADEAVGRDESERVRTAIAALPEKQRLAVTLRTYQGLSHREIGRVTGCSEGAARVNYHLGIKRLRKLLR